MTIILNHKFTQKQHTDIVLGRDKSVPRSIAINMLPSSKIRNSVSLLNKLLINEAEETQVRRLAAVNLWRSNATTATEYLLKAAKTVTNPEILGSVVKCLGRVGDKKALQAVEAIERKAQGLLKSQAFFAASLISYRHGIDGHNLPIPTKYEPMPSAPQIRLNFTAPPQAEADLFTSCLANEPYGIAFSRDLMQQYSFPGCVGILAFNQQIAEGNAISALMGKKALLGVLAAKDSEYGRYSVSYLVLSSPDAPAGKVNILIYSVTGTPAWAGMITSVDVRQANLKIRTVGRVGIVPMETEGVFLPNGKIKVTSAVAATRVSKKRHPQPLT